MIGTESVLWGAGQTLRARRNRKSASWNFGRWNYHESFIRSDGSHVSQDAVQPENWRGDDCLFRQVSRLQKYWRRSWPDMMKWFDELARARMMALESEKISCMARAKKHWASFTQKQPNGYNIQEWQKWISSLNWPVHAWWQWKTKEFPAWFAPVQTDTEPGAHQNNPTDIDILYRSDKNEVLLWTDPRTHDGNGKWKSFLHGSCPRKQALTITTTDIWGETALWFDKMSKSAILGMRMLTDGYVSRQEFDDMIHEHRAQYKIWSYSHTSDW